MTILPASPFELRSVGGRRGGGAALTPRARRLIDAFQYLEALHRQFLKQLGSIADNPISTSNWRGVS